jgi:acetyl esterase/lipase
LWDNGPPGFEAHKNQPEVAKDYWVKQVHNPSLTVFAPKPNANTGTAIVVVPGGGHALLVFPPEGVAPGQFLQGLGVTAFALKYRLAREEGSTYTIAGDAATDLRRAIRYVRAHATEYGINPNRIGVMGFSAGGELAAMAAFDPQEGNPAATDPLDRVSARPNFLIEVYPGPLGIPVRITQAPPPAFLLNANDDRMAMTTTDAIERLYDMFPDVPLERHVLSGGKHGFNMGDRSTLKAVHDWPQRLADWLSDSGLLTR